MAPLDADTGLITTPFDDVGDLPNEVKDTLLKGLKSKNLLGDANSKNAFVSYGPFDWRLQRCFKITPGGKNYIPRRGFFGLSATPYDPFFTG